MNNTTHENQEKLREEELRKEKALDRKINLEANIKAFLFLLILVFWFVTLFMPNKKEENTKPKSSITSQKD